MRARALRFLIVLAIGLAFGACDRATASFTPDGPCVADGRAPAAYADLEALLPGALYGIDGTLADISPTRVDSGRNCTPRALSTYARHGISEVRFAGATWDLREGTAMVSAIFTTPEGQPELQHAWVEEFYETGARASTKTENTEVSRPTFFGAGQVYRLDTLNDLSLQTVVIWQAGSYVRVVIVGTTVEPNASRQEHETLVSRVVAQTGELPTGSHSDPVLTSGA